MIADGLLICLVAKIAVELAHTGHSVAISGPYGAYTDRILARLMTLDGTHWDDFFFGTIIRIRGVARLASLLGTGGVLSDRSWCQAWADGIPESVKASRSTFEEAERELTEAEEEEQRMARDFLLCPHCGTLFIVGERNCGEFFCGRDAHGMNGPAIGGARVRGVYGCGRNFPIANCRRYVPDEKRLGDLRTRRDELRGRLQAHGVGESLWHRAASYRPPVLGASVENKGSDGCTIPLFTTYLAQKAPESKLATLMLLLSKGTTFANQFRLLPDLVQLYLWVHKNLSCLITKEQAVSLKLKDLMTESRLLSRFDCAHVDYMLNLWQRLLAGIKSVLEDLEYKIFFDCEEITVPFISFAEAPVCVVLSEGDHPTDGNDFLFVLIREIIGRYNDHIGRLEELAGKTMKETSDNLAAIHPASLIPGSGGAAALHRVVATSQEELDLIAECAWDRDADDFKMDQLESELFTRVFSLQHIPPEIMNPMKHLRKKFTFRQDSLDTGGTPKSKETVFFCDFGFYLVNEHDFILANELFELLRSFGLLDDRETLHGILNDIFHTFDYNQLRSLLEGVRNVFHMLQTQKVGSINNFLVALATVMDLSDETVERECDIIFQQLKFPTLNPAQTQLLLSSKAENLFEIVRYVCFQISSEAHLFSEFPLTMKEPLPSQDSKSITEKLTAMQKTDGIPLTLDWLDGFIGGVLAFYEGEIRKTASKTSNRSLVRFLRDDNPFCDDSDPVFAIIPPTVQLRNYVALRCHLHQAKLSLIRSAESASDSSTNGTNTNSESGDSDADNCATKASPHAWLCCCDTEGGFHYQQTIENGETAEGFWFERGFGSEDESNSVLSKSIHAWARKIQTWWRRHLATRTIQRVWRRRRTNGDSTAAMASEPRSQDASAKRIQNWWRRVAQAFEEISINLLDDVFYDAEIDCESLGVDESTGKNGNDVSSLPEPISAQDPTSNPVEAKSGEDPARPQLVDHSRSSQSDSMSWTMESMYGAGSNKLLYGSPEEEVLLRRWLNDIKLPQSLVAVLANVGARSVEDVVMIASEAPEILDEMNLAPLDKLKLKNASGSYSSSEVPDPKT